MNEEKLDRPARVGNVVFQKGARWANVVRCAQRNFEEFKDTNQKFDKMCEATDLSIEKALREKGEGFLPGNEIFDKIEEIISENRRDREEFESAMSEKF